MITGGFGTSIDLRTGKSRRWIMGKDQIKRWADTDEPVPPAPAVKQSLTTQQSPAPTHRFLGGEK